MKPAQFEYFRADSLGVALSALAERPDDARILAGGQSLMPMLNLRLAQPGLLVDINRIPGLDALTEDDRGMRVGATVRHADLLAHAAASKGHSLLAQAMPYIAHQGIRNRGTVCGSLALADPAAELPACAVCVDAQLTIASVRGTRTARASEFFIGLYETALESDEMIVDVRFPRAEPGWSFGFDEVSRRHGDFALAGMACAFCARDGVVAEARIVLFGVADRPLRASEAEQALVGRSLDDRAAHSRAMAALGEVDVQASGEYPANYKRNLVAVLLRRILSRSAEAQK